MYSTDDYFMTEENSPNCHSMVNLTRFKNLKEKIKGPVFDHSPEPKQWRSQMPAADDRRSLEPRKLDKTDIYIDFKKKKSRDDIYILMNDR
jgi:hypothetical protein